MLFFSACPAANGPDSRNIQKMDAPDQSSDQRQQSFLRLFMACEPALRGFVRSLVPTVADSNDVMQEVAVVLWQKFAEYKTTEDFRRWSFTVAKWKVLSWQRDQMRDRHVFGQETLELLAEESEGQAEILEAQREALRDCLGRLPAPQRDLVDSAYAPHARIDALAARIGVTAMSLYKKLHRIRALLLDCTRAALEPRNPR
jgi:RNA polymerase sigma-70 factor (ECF subfamily)